MRHRPGQVGFADNRDAVLHHRLAGLGELAVAAAVSVHIDDDHARLHRLDRAGRDGNRRRAAEEPRGRNSSGWR